MENDLSSLIFGSHLYCDALAEKFAKLKAEECYGGYIPRCIENVIKLLKEHNFQSAKDTFQWESDKMAFHKNILELGEKYF